MYLLLVLNTHKKAHPAPSYVELAYSRQAYTASTAQRSAFSPARRSIPVARMYVRADQRATTQASRQSWREPHHVVEHVYLHFAVFPKRTKKSKAAGPKKHKTTYKQQQKHQLQQQQQHLACDARRICLYSSLNQIRTTLCLRSFSFVHMK